MTFVCVCVRIQRRNRQMGEMHRARYMERGMKPSCPLQAHQHPHISMYSPTWKLSEPLSLGFSWKLHYIATIDYIIAFGNWFNLQPLSPPGVGGVWNWQFQPSNHMVGSVGNQPPSWHFQKITSMRQKTLSTPTLKKFQKFGRLWLRNCGWRL